MFIVYLIAAGILCLLIQGVIIIAHALPGWIFFPIMMATIWTIADKYDI